MFLNDSRDVIDDFRGGEAALVPAGVKDVVTRGAIQRLFPVARMDDEAVRKSVVLEEVAPAIVRPCHVVDEVSGRNDAV